MAENNNLSTSWQQSAAQKRAAVHALIPDAWCISQVPSTEERLNIAGDYIRQFLSIRETEITETEVTDILAKTTSGAWTAREVALAFCHRAAIGHQLVRRIQSDCAEATRLLTRTRSPVFTKSSLMQQLPKLNDWTNTLPNMKSPSARFMAYP